MSAPKGNEFWKLRSKHGRDKIFTDPKILWEAACEYFQSVVDNPIESQIPVKAGDHFGETVSVPITRPFTKEGLSLHLGCNTKYFANFKRGLSRDEQDFLNVIYKIEDIIYLNKFDGATVGIFNHNIIARDLGLSDKKDYSSQDGTMTPKPNIIVSDQKAAEEIKKLIDEDN